MARRFTASTINWKELAERVPPEQKSHFLAFKAKSEGYLRRMKATPPEPPKIDWEAYEHHVPVPGLVVNFRKAYEAYKVPYPADKWTKVVDNQWSELQPQIEEYSAEMKKNIESAQSEIDKIKSLPRYEDMTLEMWYDTYPQDAIDFVNSPSFWPHTEDEQMGYKDPMQKV